MKIAILAPLVRPVREDVRGSRPRLVYDLVKILTARGHQITTFASGDSLVAGKTIKVSPKAIYLMPPAENPFYQQTIYIAKLINLLMEQSDEFDIIHNHTYPEFLPVLMTPFLKTPMLTTIHLPITAPIAEFLKKYPRTFFTSVSDDQRKSIKGVNFIGTVHNGIDIQEFPFTDNRGDYFLFFGRMGGSDPKGLEVAIQIAEKTGEKLKIAGNVTSQEYFDKKIKPHLNDKIQFIGPVDPEGPIGFKEKVELYQHAKALLFPIKWPEPFGIVMIEAMACGTPVIAFDKGAVREVVRDGVTGFICRAGDTSSMIEAMKNINQIKRINCRQHVEKNFTLTKMVDSYEGIYQKILSKNV